MKVKVAKNETNGVFLAEEINVFVIDVDLDVDSDNNNGVAPPDRNDKEDDLELEEALGGKFGKFVMVNQNDDDRDEIPDYADLKIVANGAPGSVDEGQFVPLVLEIQPDVVDWSTATVKFEYEGHPVLPDEEDFAGDNIGNGFTNYLKAKKGKMRIWRIDSPSEERNSDKYIIPGQNYIASELGFSDAANSKTFYIEGINKVEKSKIKATLKIGTFFECQDRVAVTVVDANLGVNCNNNLENGDDLRTGIPDVAFRINLDDDLIEDQQQGFKFWHSDEPSVDSTTITKLGLVDLAPMVIDVPDSLIEADFKFYLRSGQSLLHVFPAASPSTERRQFLQQKPTGLAQVDNASEGKIVGVTAEEMDVVDGLNEFVFRSPSSTSTDETILELLVEEKDNPGVFVVADSVKLTLLPTRGLYTLVSTRGTPNTPFPYVTEDTNTAGPDFRRYPDATRAQDTIAPVTAKSRYLVYVHGFRVSLDLAHETGGEVFKRTFWTGYRGNFIIFAWEGDEFPALLFQRQSQNAFQTSPALRNYLQIDLGSLGATASDIDVFAHSLGNQVALDALRLFQIDNPGVRLVNTMSCVEPAIWGETFFSQATLVYPSIILPFPQEPITYSVSDQKRHSWAFWFNQSGHRAHRSAFRLINSFNRFDYALIGMKIDDVEIRNRGGIQFSRPEPSGFRVPYEDFNGGRNLANKIPALMRQGRRQTPVFPFFLEHPQGMQVNPITPFDINASSFGYSAASHAGHVGDEFFLVAGETPLYQVWEWYIQLVCWEAYPIGKE